VKPNPLIAEAHRLVPNIAKGQAAVYFLRLNSGTIYVGCSTNLDQRLDDHLCGQACRTTQVDPPAAILRVEILPTFSEARRREAQLKRWSRAKKEALIRGELTVLRKLSHSRSAARSKN
jgi:putative endonuclease